MRGKKNNRCVLVKGVNVFEFIHPEELGREGCLEGVATNREGGGGSDSEASQSSQTKMTEPDLTGGAAEAETFKRPLSEALISSEFPDK